MNKAMNENARWAFLGGLITAGRGNIFVSTRGNPERPQTQLWLTFVVDADIAGLVCRWLKGAGRNAKMGRTRNTNRIRFHFVDSEAHKVILKTFGHIEEMAKVPGKPDETGPEVWARLMLLSKCKLALDYWRTMQKRGIRLPYDARKERFRVLKEFDRIKERTKAKIAR